MRTIDNAVPLYLKTFGVVPEAQVLVVRNSNLPFEFPRLKTGLWRLLEKDCPYRLLVKNGGLDPRKCSRDHK